MTVGKVLEPRGGLRWGESMATFGVLIDAEKIPALVVGPALMELRRFGEPMIKRAYADWSLPESGGWARELARHAIIPMARTEPSAGRHALDTALVVHALDLRHHGILDSYAILCDDDSFIGLAARLRASGATVVGCGLTGVSTAFVRECDAYVDLDVVMTSASAARVALARAAMVRTA
jgi:hypothetical protein